MSDDENFGRRRESMADIQAVLDDVFWEHPNHTVSDSGEPSIGAQYFPEIFKAFAERYHGEELFSDIEKHLLGEFINMHPDVQATPSLLLQFLAQVTRDSPGHSPNEDEERSQADYRGRDGHREGQRSSRSSSNESSGTTGGRSRPPSRPGSRASLNRVPSTPAPHPESPFDTSRRQRSTPLNAVVPPSSWNRPPPTSRRRKSDAGAYSDSEESSTRRPSRPSSRQGGRVRAPSSPSSPSMSMSSPPIGFQSFSANHAHSQSQPFASPPDSPSDDRTYRFTSPELSFADSINSLPMPSSGGNDSDDEEGLVMDLAERSLAPSNASMDGDERMEALRKVNADLLHQLEQEHRNYQSQLAANESEIEDLQIKLDEAKSELQATKREEKELRNKERSYTSQISTLESEVLKMTKQLETAKTTYASLQKQYQEQCTESERYRDNLRRRDEEIKDFIHDEALQRLEQEKWARSEQSYEERLQGLTEEINVAREAYTQLEEQKQENLMLKETIDRMRFDMDEMRNNSSSGINQGPTTGPGSAQGSVSKSLGAELSRKLKNEEGWTKEEDSTEDDSTVVESEFIVNDGEETEGEEDVIQTIITRKKKKVASRANQPPPTTIRYEETKEYSDAYTQYESAEFSRSNMVQTDPEPVPVTFTLSTQTEDRPTGNFGAQTDPEPEPVAKVTMEMDIQTDPIEEKKPSSAPRPSKDLPPDYEQATEEDVDGLPLSQIADPETRKTLAIRADTLRKWHRGAKLPFEPIDGGVSEDAIEEWNALKEELGLDCMVIDNVIATSQRTGQPRPGKDGKLPSRLRRSRFYNIYNTYVYGGNKDGSSGSTSSFTSSAATQILLGIGASAIFFMAMGPYSAQYTPLGGVTYYDRAAWSSFNSMHPTGEGIAPDGTAAVWSILGRVGGGAARIAQGWPT